MQTAKSFEALKSNYLRRRREDIETYQKAFKELDFGTLEMMGHRLKGNAASFGRDELGLWGDQLEQASHNHDVTAIKNLLDVYPSLVLEERESAQSEPSDKESSD